MKHYLLTNGEVVEGDLYISAVPGELQVLALLGSTTQPPCLPRCHHHTFCVIATSQAQHLPTNSMYIKPLVSC